MPNKWSSSWGSGAIGALFGTVVSLLSKRFITFHTKVFMKGCVIGGVAPPPESRDQVLHWHLHHHLELEDTRVGHGPHHPREVEGVVEEVEVGEDIAEESSNGTASPA